MSGLIQDLRQTVRFLGSRPGFTSVIVVTLGLAIGFNVALFTVLNALLLRPLPYERPHELVSFDGLTPGEFLDFHPQSFASGAWFQRWGLRLRTRDEHRAIWGFRVSANLFDVLGVRPAIGRTFQPDDESVSAAPVVVLSHDLWQRLSGDTALIGQTITLGDRPYTVIGVMPASFWFSYRDSAMWVPAQMTRAELRQGDDVWMVGRLQSGRTIKEAQAEMNSIAQRRQGGGAVITAETRPIRLKSLESATRAYAPTVLLLQVAVGFVLLIACANIANLLLVRANARRGEFAIRTALGATRNRLVRQVLVECGLLSLLGSVVGVLLASNSLGIIQAHVPAQLLRSFRFSQTETLGLDLRVLAFTVLLCGLATIAFGLVPALRASRPDLNTDLKESSRSSGMGRRRQALGRLLLIAELALSMALLVGAGGMVKSLVMIQRKELGFQTDQVMRVYVELASQREGEGGQSLSTFQRIAERLRTLPGVQMAGVADHVYPVTGSAAPSGRPLRTQTPSPSGGPARGEIFRVDDQYFRVIGVTVKRGRSFGSQDRPGSVPVGIVGESLADRLWPHEDPVGKVVRVESRDESNAEPWITIVGVVSDVYHPLGRSAQPLLYLAYTQDSDPVSWRSFVLRTALPAATMTPAIRAAVQEMAPNAMVDTVSMDVSDFAAQNRFVTAMISSFTGLALVLALVGVYGVMHFWVAERVHEIGLRMALGARQLDTVILVVRSGMKLAVLGITCGLVGGVTLSRLLAREVLGAQPADPLMIVGLSLVLLGAATLACFVPARQACRIDPTATLRSE
jgi:putative ABC transport system permease protein